MPYNNQNNREIAEKVKNFIDKSIEHEKKNLMYFAPDIIRTQVLVPTLKGSAKKTEEENVNENDFVYNPDKFAFQNFGKATQPETSAKNFFKSIGYDESAYKELEGGAYGSISGFAKGTRMDTGEEKTEGVQGGQKRIIGGKKRGRKPKAKMEEGVAIFKEEKMKGGKMLNSVMNTMTKVANKLGVKIPNEKMVGGVDLGRPHNMVNDKGLTGDGKHMKGGKLVPKAQMQSSTLSGFGKKNKRGELVKKIMKERRCSLGEASKIIKNEKLM
jgi:hypothetical protein